ncbi:hypothetical protein OG2516_10376 [Oceanicola granulosus HTCC2516]|uniref:Phosphatidate phosphatase APP1 catalytic domain-containing protein n=1 Tax=Oceanicola granulosus (strain ATCC BAA-861 / DSM 15982 / KCTC 12143 / HTCC2516) TaxID=314256 RepID=Q2CKC8_OCEGH|nr:phosphatase domain-containing protein [Oceanicola granulosus]EAR52861.1 hypothetical protein OG2516_10376 [Oceanicola granulosus HTCC2516]
MRLGRRFVAGLARVERLLDRRRRRRSVGKEPVIEPYIGYATPDEIVLRGRIVTGLRRHEPRPDQHWLTNLRQMVRLFLTNEVSGVAIQADGHHARSDEEGYFLLPVPRQGRSGWVEIKVEHMAQVPAPGALSYAWEPGSEGVVAARLPAFVPGEGASFGVISDVDDTMMDTGAWSRTRMLWTSFTGNIHTRHIFPDAVKLMTRLSDGERNPVFYVSSSPWNLHNFLERVFARHGLARGPLFLRDLGLGENKFISGGHGDHKGKAIDLIVEANPGLPFVLIGDTGQLDAAIYDAAARRHPGRIVRVILRTSSAGTDAADDVHIRTLRSRGIPVHVGETYAEALASLDAAPTLAPRARRMRRMQAEAKGT